MAEKSLVQIEVPAAQIENLAWQAMDAAPNARNLCSGIHVFSQFHGKLAAGYERFRRCKR